MTEGLRILAQHYGVGMKRLPGRDSGDADDQLHARQSHSHH